MKRYRTLADVQRQYRYGFAVRHEPYALIAGQVPAEDRVYYTWHKGKASAWRELKCRPIVGDERVIPIMATDLYWAERHQVKALRLERRRNRHRASGPPVAT